MSMNIEMPKGYKLLANYKNEVILAESENKETPEPYVTWLISNGSDVHTGCYFSKLQSSQLNFAERAFGISSDKESLALSSAVNKDIMEEAIQITMEILFFGNDMFENAAKRNGSNFRDLMTANISSMAESILGRYQRILYEVINVNPNFS